MKSVATIPQAADWGTFHDARPAFLDGSDTPRAYLERCLETIDTREPTVQAWVTLNTAGPRAGAENRPKR
ncbi:MAG: hypothetical protein Ct9H300mP16_09500 [Pseudomonadota bacterium]|nr:MAG: hypothetical protein Ct9H300mP16_09500 [Pseudomonadota bacterium]